jgi:hypothetical protein
VSYFGDGFFMGEEVEPAFGGEFFAFFGNEGGLIGFYLEGETGHGIDGGHFQIEAGCDGLAYQSDIPFLNVAAIFAEVDGDTIGTADDGERSGGDGIGVVALAGLPHGGHMVDIDTQTQHDGNLLN